MYFERRGLLSVSECCCPRINGSNVLESVDPSVLMTLRYGSSKGYALISSVQYNVEKGTIDLVETNGLRWRDMLVDLAPYFDREFLASGPQLLIAIGHEFRHRVPVSL